METRMSKRPIFDTAALWNGLTDEQRRAIGVAAIDREITLHGRDFIDLDDFGGDMDVDADDRLFNAIEAAIDLIKIDHTEFPLPSFKGA
ncbi:hypothetical protein [Niveispirillum fermenti]|uniref:hypothetical protein n=1 Tax=Niveispirillum fermenti TaxID=1233113 RepID=UPI003A89F8D7